MEFSFSLGFPAALAWQSLGLFLLGALIGTVLGGLLGSVAAFAAAVPLLTLTASPGAAVATIAGLLYGAQYGASIWAILFGVPGSAHAVATTFDGYPMANHGETPRALGATLVASFLACTIASLFIAVMAVQALRLSVSLGPVENVALLIASLALAVAFAGGAPPKAFLMVLLGLGLAYVGPDPETNMPRLTFGWDALADGLPSYAVALGLVVFAAALTRFETAKLLQPAATGPSWPRFSDLKQIAGPALRGGIVGTLLGLLPSSRLSGPFVAYRLEKWLTADRERFGAGAVEGVAAPEAANNAGVATAFIPFFALGIPGDAITGLMAGVLSIHGIVPGPQLLTKVPDLFWGMIALMWIGNLMVLVLGFSLVGAFVKLLLLPRRLVLGAMIAIGCVSAYAVDGRFFDVGIAVFFGLLGYALAKGGFEPVPMLIGFLLGPGFEENLRRTLLITRGSFVPFVQKPLSAALLLSALLITAWAFWSWARQKRAS
jgi:putative tricarboxylic transport membrane protein